MRIDGLSKYLNSGLDDEVSLTNECHYAFNYDISSGYNLLKIIFSKWLSILYAYKIRNNHSIRIKWQNLEEAIECHF
jgi:hypothetical protein